MKNRLVTKISLFDLDHTLLTKNSSFLFGFYLYKQHYFSTPKLLKLLFTYFFHKLGFLSLTKLHKKIFNSLFYGKNSHSITSLVNPFLDQHLEKMIYKPAFQKLKEAKEKYHYVAILSNSPDFLVSAIAARFLVDDWRATCYEIGSEGNFSKISYCFEGIDKAKYLNLALADFNLQKKDLAAYSDSILDLTFLEKAGTSVAVRPDRQLKKRALRKGWEII